MKRTIVILALLTIAVPSWALKGTPDTPKRPMRIGVLHTGDGWADASYDTAAAAIEREIALQLHDRGLEAWETHQTLRDAYQDRVGQADLYISGGGDARFRELGDLDVSGPHTVGSLGLVISKCAAEVRVYDGGTLALVDHFQLSHRRWAVVPTSLGLHNRRFVALAISVIPIVQHLQYRSAIRGVAEEAVQRIASR